MSKYVIGLDYGTDSCRALIVDASNGQEMATSVKYYPRWKEGKYCDPSKNQYRQHPLDYLEVMEASIIEALSKCDPSVAKNVTGIAFDTTGSTPALTDNNGTPLALLPEFAENPNAMFILWKDHTAVKEADEINELARKWEIDYTKYEGGIYSSEWVWAKVLHTLRNDKTVASKAFSWVEYCDWLPGVLTGNINPATILRGRCAAGHKALWHPDWNGLPPEEFLVALGKELKGFRDHLFTETHTSKEKAGTLTPEWATKLGLSTDVIVGVSAFDCHMGAVGAEIEPNTLVRVIGTSTCDIIVASNEDMEGKLIPGICGQVDGSVIPGMIGLEAGQSAFGDVYAWFKNVLAWPLNFIDDAELRKSIEDKLIPVLSDEAAKIPVEESTIIATDWLNGRRTPDADQNVKATITGLTLGSSAPRIFRALVEATAYGSKAIAERFIENGIEIKQVVGIGGVAKKSSFVMQTLADVMNMPIKVARAEQCVALGAAMFAAVASGLYPTVEEAQKAMGQGFEKTYYPIQHNVEVYEKLYREYQRVGSIL
ncbi:MAG TPA: ribulokinase [Prolixibacteraceae bacterium]|jgi:L-ribulokinase|nr:ribulokinase [Prolixibacteraceae bacterium]